MSEASGGNVCPAACGIQHLQLAWVTSPPSTHWSLFLQVMEQHFHIQCHASTIPFTGHCRLSTNLNPPQILSLEMSNGGSGIWEQPAALQQLLCQPRAFGVSSEEFSSPQVGPGSAGRRKNSSCVLFRASSCWLQSGVSWGKPPDLPRVSDVL